MTNERISFPMWIERQRGTFFNDILNPSRRDNIGEVIDLTTGSPRGEPFKPAVNSAHYTLNQKDVMSGYYSSPGTFYTHYFVPYLKELGIVKDEKDFNRGNMVPGNGVTQLYTAAIQTLLKPEDVMLVPVPTYGFFLKLAHVGKMNVVPLPLKPENGFRLTPELLEENIVKDNENLARSGKKISVFLNINPHNPTGHVYDKADIEAFSRILNKHGVRLVIDDMVYKGTEYAHHNPRIKGKIAAPFASIDGMFDKTVTFLGLSKAYSLAGLRAGLAVGPKELINPIQKYMQDQVEFLSNPSQSALAAVFGDKNAPERNQYLCDQAQDFRKKQLLLRIMINGWENDQEARNLTGFPNRSKYAEHIFPVEDIGVPPESIDKISLLLKNIDKIVLPDVELPDSRKMKPDMKTIARFYKIGLAEAKRHRTALMQQIKGGVPGMHTLPGTEAGFFQLIDVTGLKGKFCGQQQLNSELDFTKALSNAVGVLVLPGSTMGYYGDRLIIRVSFSPDKEKILEGVTRMKRFVNELTTEPHHVEREASNVSRFFG